MASSEAFRPITTLQEPGLLGMPRTYTSQREVAAETEPPARGSVLGNILGPQFATHIILDASIQPKDGKRILNVSHCSAPAWTTLLGSGDRQDGLGEHLYSQQVVPTPTQSAIEADTLSSYQPIDEAKSLKRTKKPRKKKTDGTYEDGYPQQQVKAIGSENPPPQRYRRQSISNETATTETLPSANVNDIPDTAYLSGNQTKIVHQKLNDDQYRKTVTEQTLTLNTSSVDESVERKPFVSIKSTMTPGSSISLAATGNASSRLVYENGDTKIYENVAEVATARPGPAGTEKDEKPFVRLTSNKKYSTSSDVATATGSSNVVFNDGSVQVYEVSEVTATAKTGFKGVETDAQQWGAIKSTTNYTTSSSPPEGGSVNIIYNDGAVTVYEATETVPSVAGSSKDVEPREWGSLIWDGTFGTTTSDEKSTQVWSNGVNQVYKNEKATLVVKSGSFVSKKEVNPLYTETITSSFSTSPSISGAVGESSAVFSIADKVVYENRIIEVSSSTTRYYGTVVRYPVPATLIGIERSDFPRRDGTLEIHYRAIIAEGTDGYMPAKVIEKFEKVPSGPTKPIKSFKPSPVAFTTPYGSFSVGATLHGDLSFWITTGTTDPIYEYIYQPVSIPATVPPTTAGFGDVLVSYTSEPFKDGFITREVYVTF